MIIEKRTLPVGVEFNGTLHRGLEIRPRLVADMVDVLENERSARNDRYYGLAMLACQIVKLGDIPKEEISADLLLTMYEQDFDVLTEAAEQARTRVEGFYSGSGESQKTQSDGAAQGPQKSGSDGPKDGFQAQ